MLGRSPAQPCVRVSVPMNDANNTDRRGENLVVDAVRESPQEHATKMTPNDRVALRSLFDQPHGVVYCLKEPLGG